MSQERKTKIDNFEPVAKKGMMINRVKSNVNENLMFPVDLMCGPIYNNSLKIGGSKKKK